MESPSGEKVGKPAELQQLGAVPHERNMTLSSAGDNRGLPLKGGADNLVFVPVGLFIVLMQLATFL